VESYLSSIERGLSETFSGRGGPFTFMSQ
jgi:hypothetical protein